MAGVGILGGTFNPPHLGHLAAARCALERLQLSRVLLMPVHTPPHKLAGKDPGPAHRIAMCALLAEREPHVEACDLELRRDGPSYTVDTLESIHAGHPEAELTFIVGADTARTLPTWREPARVLELARLAVVTRPGSEHAQVQAAVEAVAHDGTARVSYLEMAPVDISSSAARERARRGEPLEELLGPAVAGYVSDHRLYGAGAPREDGGGS